MGGGHQTLGFLLGGRLVKEGTVLDKKPQYSEGRLGFPTQVGILSFQPELGPEGQQQPFPSLLWARLSRGGRRERSRRQSCFCAGEGQAGVSPSRERQAGPRCQQTGSPSRGRDGNEPGLQTEARRWPAGVRAQSRADT